MNGDNVSLATVFVSELAGTAVLLLLGGGVVANVLLTKSKGFDGGWLLINIGWGFGVMAGVYIAFKSGGHLNPAVTLGIASSGADEYAPGVAVSFGATLVYLAGQFLGAFLGACATYLTYKKHFDAEPDAGKKLAVFATGPAIRDYRWNLATEFIATFVLVLVIVSLGKTPSGLGPLAAALLVVGIGASLGGPTGYAINPARDLGPRIAHAVLPMRHTAAAVAHSPSLGAAAAPTAEEAEDSSDWAYAWVPVLGPVLGGIAAGLVSQLIF
ncbi:MIP/aquaporin family protein [Nocardia goodfellowii]